MVSESGNVLSPSNKGKTCDDVTVKQLMEMILLNVVFVGTFSVQRYISPLKQYRYMVCINKLFNKDKEYEKLTQDLELLRKYIQQNSSSRVWIGFEETEDGWVIWSDLLDMPFCNRSCEISEVRVSDTEVGIELVCRKVGVDSSVVDEPKSPEVVELPNRLESWRSNLNKLCVLLKDMWHTIRQSRVTHYVMSFPILLWDLVRWILTNVFYIIHLLYHVKRHYNLDFDSRCKVCICQIIFDKIKNKCINRKDKPTLSEVGAIQDSRVNSKGSDRGKAVNRNNKNNNNNNGKKHQRSPDRYRCNRAKPNVNRMTNGNSNNTRRNFQNQYETDHSRRCYECGRICVDNFSLRNHREYFHRPNMHTRG